MNFVTHGHVFDCYCNLKLFSSDLLLKWYIQELMRVQGNASDVNDISSFK